MEQKRFYDLGKSFGKGSVTYVARVAIYCSKKGHKFVSHLAPGLYSCRIKNKEGKEFKNDFILQVLQMLPDELGPYEYNEKVCLLNSQTHEKLTWNPFEFTYQLLLTKYRNN